MVAMTPEQLAFWRALLAPFHPDELSTVPKRGGKGELTYLDKRAIENRLDTVCGPHGWFPEFESTARGYKCRLSILVPMTNGAWVWMHKEDGAGFEEMGSVNRQTNEWEADVDNDEKSGYTNALRRAAQDAWGIGRYLYRKGIPAWLDPNASPEDALRPQARLGGDDTTHRSPNSGCQDKAPEIETKPEITRTSHAPFVIPPAGHSVFQWCRQMEEHFKTRLFDGMKNGAIDRGLEPTKGFTWDQEAVHAICGEAIAFIKSLPTYKGEFDHLVTPERNSEKNSESDRTGEIRDLRKKLQTKIVALAEMQLGRKPNIQEQTEAFGNIASECPNSAGCLGEVPESLKSLTDMAWLRNMNEFVDEQIKRSHTASADAEADEIPF